MIGTAHSEQPPNKPFKVCPEIVTAKDTPCRVLPPTASIVNRIEVNLDNKDQEIRRLREENALLKQLLNVTKD